jgi:hypothetical protein
LLLPLLLDDGDGVGVVVLSKKDPQLVVMLLAAAEAGARSVSPSAMASSDGIYLDDIDSKVNG